MARNRIPLEVTGERRTPGKSHARSRGGQGHQVQSADKRGADFEIEWSPAAYKDYHYWRETNPAVASKIDTLIASVLTSPFAGIGKPEPLKHKLAGYWSRRITHEHRLIYRVQAGELFILSCRYHY